MRNYTVQIKSTYKEVDAAVDDIVSYIEDNWNIKDEHVVFTINFALRELLMNAVEHGNRMIEEKKIICEIGYKDKYVCIDVSDEGDGFKLEKRMLEIEKEDVLRLRGRGIHIMAKMGFDICVKDNHVMAKISI